MINEVVVADKQLDGWLVLALSIGQGGKLKLSLNLIYITEGDVSSLSSNISAIPFIFFL